MKEKGLIEYKCRETSHFKEFLKYYRKSSELTLECLTTRNLVLTRKVKKLQVKRSEEKKPQFLKFVLDVQNSTNQT